MIDKLLFMILKLNHFIKIFKYFNSCVYENQLFSLYRQYI
jgi:hypothetical protein